MISGVLASARTVVTSLLLIGGAFLSSWAQPLAAGTPSATCADQEKAAAVEPNAVLPQFDLARCYDVAWRFADAERIILRLLDLVRHELSKAAIDPPAPPTRLVAGGDVPKPVKVRDAGMEYPDMAVEGGIRGVVVVEATIDRRGRVRQAKAVESVAGLDSAAVNTVRQWQFEPIVVKGQPAEVVAYYFMRFAQPKELMPADWVDISRFYYRRGLYAQCLEPLEAALARERRDQERFAAPSVSADDFEPLQTGTEEPAKTRDVRPVYPRQVGLKGIQGTVVIDAIIDRFGDVGRARVVKSIPMLDAAAIDAVLGWGYTPPMQDGVPTIAWLTVKVAFNLR